MKRIIILLLTKISSQTTPIYITLSLVELKIEQKVQDLLETK